jgi:hypothetical protein
MRLLRKQAAMNLQSVPIPIAQPSKEDLRLLSFEERQCWLLLDGRKTLEDLAWHLDIPNRQDVRIYRMILKFVRKEWLRVGS